MIVKMVASCIEAFQQEQPPKSKSRSINICFYKYKCIIIYTILCVMFLQSIYMIGFKNINWYELSEFLSGFKQNLTNVSFRDFDQRYISSNASLSNSSNSEI